LCGRLICDERDTDREGASAWSALTSAQRDDCTVGPCMRLHKASRLRTSSSAACSPQRVQT